MRNLQSRQLWYQRNLKEGQGHIRTVIMCPFYVMIDSYSREQRAECLLAAGL